MSVRTVDESETGSANFFCSHSGVLLLRFRPPRRTSTEGARRASGLELPAMHLRPPAFSHGFTSFLWGAGLGLFVWIGLLGIGVSAGIAFIVGFLAALAIFFYVLLSGGHYRR